jgi:cation-transporting ATPase 13A1
MSSNDGDEGLILFDDIASKDNDEPTLPRETLRVLVGCQSLATTHAFVPGQDGRTTVVNKLVGDPMEKAVMDACLWTLLPGGNDTVVETNRSPSSSIRILHRFCFTSTLRRMTVLAIDNEETTSKDDIWALTKGSPETIMPLLDPKSFNQEVYTQLYKRQMALGRRVLGLAYKNLGKNTVSKVEKWTSCRDKVERNLIFAGLLIMDSPLKADTSRIIKELRAGQQTTVMVTGDAALTAAEVARRVGIIDAPENATYEVRMHIQL